MKLIKSTICIHEKKSGPIIAKYYNTQKVSPAVCNLFRLCKKKIFPLFCLVMVTNQRSRRICMQTMTFLTSFLQDVFHDREVLKS